MRMNRGKAIIGFAGLARLHGGHRNEGSPSTVQEKNDQRMDVPMATPPKTPPQQPPKKNVERSSELEREEAAPSETVEDMSEEEKGLPPDAKTTWN